MTIFLAVFATSRQALPPRDTICNSETFCHFETRFTQLRDILPPRDMTFCHMETWHVSIWQPPLKIDWQSSYVATIVEESDETFQLTL